MVRAVLSAQPARSHRLTEFLGIGWVGHSFYCAVRRASTIRLIASKERRDTPRRTDARPSARPKGLPRARMRGQGMERSGTDGSSVTVSLSYGEGCAFDARIEPNCGLL